jgi:hypothetical protein
MMAALPLERAQKILAREQIGAHGRNARTSSTTPSHDEPFAQDSVQLAGQQRRAVATTEITFSIPLQARAAMIQSCESAPQKACLRAIRPVRVRLCPLTDVMQHGLFAVEVVCSAITRTPTAGLGE